MDTLGWYCHSINNRLAATGLGSAPAAYFPRVVEIVHVATYYTPGLSVAGIDVVSIFRMFDP